MASPGNAPATAAAAFLRVWTCAPHGTALIGRHSQAPAALTAGLRSFSSASRWDAADDVASALAALAAHSPTRVGSHTPAHGALRDAAISALALSTMSVDTNQAARNAAAACLSALAAAMPAGVGADSVPAALRKVLSAVAASPGAVTAHPLLGTAAADAVTALQRASPS